MLKNFLGKINADKSQQPAPDGVPPDQSNETESEGFICPVCMTSLPTPEQLQNHYERSHQASGPSPNRDGDVMLLRQELNELKTSLKEEKWYSTELKKEVDKLHVGLSEKAEKNSQDGPENSPILQQLRSSEENRQLLTSEIMLLRKQLAEGMETNQALKRERDAMGQKAGNLATENVQFRARIDEVESDRIGLREQLDSIKRELEAKTSMCDDVISQLNHRPTSDDVSALNRELASLQSLMDECLQEKDKAVMEWQEKHQALNVNFKRSQQDLSRLQEELQNAPRADDIRSLEATLSEKSSQMEEELGAKLSELAQLHHEFSSMQTEIKEKTNTITGLQSDLSVKQSDVKRLERELSELNQENGSMLTELENRDRTEADLSTKVKNLEDGISQMKEQLIEMSQNLVAAEMLRTDQENELSNKAEEVAALLIRLEVAEQAVASKSASIGDLNKQLDELNQQHVVEASRIDDLEALLRGAKSQRDEDARRAQVREQKFTELDQCLEISRQELKRLQEERVDLIAKIESGAGVETAIAQLTQEKQTLHTQLEDLRLLTNGKADSFQAEIETLHGRLVQCQNDKEGEQSRSKKLEIALRESDDKSKELLDKLRLLNTDLSTKVELLVVCETSMAAQKTDLESRINSAKRTLVEKCAELDGVRAQLTGVTEELSTKKTDFNNAESLNKSQKEEINKLQEALDRLQETFAEKDVHINSLSLQLSQRDEKLQQVIASATSLESRLTQSQTTLSDKERELSMCQKQQQSLSNDLQERIEALSRAEKTRSDHEYDLQIKTEKLDELSTAINQLTKNLKEKENILAQKNSELEELSKLKLEWESNRDELREERDRYKGIKENLEKTLDAERDKCSNLEEQLSVGHQRLCTEKTNITNIQETVLGLAEKLRMTEEASQERLMKNADLNAKLQSLTSQFEEKTKLSEQQLTKKEDIQRDLQKKIEETTEKCNQHERELAVLRRQLKEKEEESAVQGSVLADNGAEIRRLTARVEELQQTNIALSDRTSQLDLSLASVTDETSSLIATKCQLESEVADLEKSVQSISEQLSAAQLSNNQMSKIIDQNNTRSQSMEKEGNELRESNKKLTKQKDDMQKLIKDQQTEFNKVKLQFDDAKQRARYAEEKLTAENFSLQGNLDNVKKRLASVEEEKSAHEVECQAQMKALTQNLSSLRTELLTAQDQHKALHDQFMEVGGQKLEVEAKLENNNDERRVLLERCLNSESECDKLREKCVEMRRKWDDTQAALQELGRENQALQITHSKVQDRTWFDDRAVTSCMACQQLFSVTVRKHHCRHCGKIYCHDCSSHSAPLASSKNPVRVCDPCYSEINQNRRASVTITPSSRLHSP